MKLKPETQLTVLISSVVELTTNFLKFAILWCCHWQRWRCLLAIKLSTQKLKRENIKTDQEIVYTYYDRCALFNSLDNFPLVT